LTKVVPLGPHTCTASPAGEHRVTPGAHTPVHPVPATQVRFSAVQSWVTTVPAGHVLLTLPLQVAAVPIAQPHDPPPVTGLQTCVPGQVTQRPPLAPQALALAVGEENGTQLALVPAAAVQHPLLQLLALHVQTPATHAAPAPHLMPQPPQLLTSVCSGTHAAPHGVWPVGHWQLSVVALHVSPAATVAHTV
jgi:hypothetical protein